MPQEPPLRILRHMARRVLRGTDQVGVLRQHSPRPLVPPALPQLAGPAVWPTLALVTPSLNQSRYLGQAMSSIYASDYPALEYVVMDGGSTDGSIEMISSWTPRGHFWTSGPDQGQADAINHGFARTSGSIMSWLNADDVLFPGALHYVAAYFAAHPDVDAIYSHRIVIDEAGDEIGRWLLPEHDKYALQWLDYVPQETLFWRRRLWGKVGALDRSFHYALDWDLLLRFGAAGARLRRLPVFLGAFRVHAAQKTAQEVPQPGRPDYEERRKILRRIHGREVTEQELSRHLRAYLRQARWYRWRRKLGLAE